jgi:hypothetical protein
LTKEDQLKAMTHLLTRNSVGLFVSMKNKIWNCFKPEVHLLCMSNQKALKLRMKKSQSKNQQVKKRRARKVRLQLKRLLRRQQKSQLKKWLKSQLNRSQLTNLLASWMNNTGSK